MTITVRYIDGAGELDTRWSEIWLLLDELDQFHADLHKKELRSGRDEWQNSSLRSALQGGDFWLQVAEQDGEIVGIESLSVLSIGTTHPGPIGYLSNTYLKESVRGHGLYWRMMATKVETLRQRGITLWEAANLAANARIFEVLGSDTWGSTLRRPLRNTSASPPMPLRRVKNLDEDWTGIWRLLQPSANGTETEARTRAEAALAERGAVFVAGQEPAGVIIGRIAVNPWIFVERVGKVSDLEIEEGGDEDISQALLGRLERWMISKQATEIETPLLRHGEYQAWSDRGFQSYLFWRQHRVQT